MEIGKLKHGSAADFNGKLLLHQNLVHVSHSNQYVLNVERKEISYAKSKKIQFNKHKY